MIKLVSRSETYPLRYFDSNDSPTIVLADLLDCGTGKIPWRLRAVDEKIASKMKHKMLPFFYPSWMNLLVFSAFVTFIGVHIVLLITLIFTIKSLFRNFDLVSSGIWAISFIGLAYLLLILNKYWCNLVFNIYPNKLGLSITDYSKFWEDNRLFFSGYD